MKNVKMIMAAILATITLTSCVYSDYYTTSATAVTTKQDIESTLQTGNRLVSNQPTPNDIDYSLERYNLIKRAYWVNGHREKANTLVCQVEKPLGYIVLFTESGAIVNSFVVDGKYVEWTGTYLYSDIPFIVENPVVKIGE